MMLFPFHTKASLQNISATTSSTTQPTLSFLKEQRKKARSFQTATTCSSSRRKRHGGSGIVKIKNVSGEASECRSDAVLLSASPETLKQIQSDSKLSRRAA